MRGWLALGGRSPCDLRPASVCGRRAHACLKLEPHSGCRPILPREEAARGSACNKDERCKHRSSCPAPWPTSRRLGRHACTRRYGRDGRPPRPRLFARFRKEPARALGQHVVDERELRADRAQIFRDSRCGPQRLVELEHRALDGVWPRRHRDSLTSLAGGSRIGRETYDPPEKIAFCMHFRTGVDLSKRIMR
jgi:hypothetical protein